MQLEILQYYACFLLKIFVALANYGTILRYHQVFYYIIFRTSFVQLMWRKFTHVDYGLYLIIACIFCFSLKVKVFQAKSSLQKSLQKPDRGLKAFRGRKKVFANWISKPDLPHAPPTHFYWKWQKSITWQFTTSILCFSNTKAALTSNSITDTWVCTTCSNSHFWLSYKYFMIYRYSLLLALLQFYIHW